MNRLHRRNKRRRIWGLVWTALIICWFGYFVVQAIMIPFRINELKENKVVTIGKINNASAGYRNIGSFEYTFIVNNKEYKGNTSSKLSVVQYELLIGRTFPVIYSKYSIKNNKMLFKKIEFKRYGMQQPDSLNWLE